MNHSDLRTNLHKLIDEIENDQLLTEVNDSHSNSKDQNEGDLWNHSRMSRGKKYLFQNLGRNTKKTWQITNNRKPGVRNGFYTILPTVLKNLIPDQYSGIFAL